jgi:hypothetical protein
MRSGIRDYGAVVLCLVALLLASCGGGTQDHQAGDALVPEASLAPGRVTSQNPVELRISPTAEKLSIAEAASVEIRLDHATDLYGLHLLLKFDPTKLVVQDSDPAQEGVQVASGALPVPDFTVVNKVDNEQGMVEYAVTQLNPREPAQGDGVVAVINFQGVGTGVSPLTFSYAKLAGPDGHEIPVEAASLTLEVSELGSAARSGVGSVQSKD